MATGLTNSSDDSKPPKGFKGLPQPAINDSFGLTIPGEAPAIGILCMPGYFVPPQATVRVRARAGNASVLTTALSRDGLYAANADVVTPDTEIIYPVSNLAQIWVMGRAGDSVNVSVRANPTP